MELGGAVPPGNGAHLQPELPEGPPREDDGSRTGPEADEDPGDLPQRQPPHRLPKGRAPFDLQKELQDVHRSDRLAEAPRLQPLVPPRGPRRVERAALCGSAGGGERILGSPVRRLITHRAGAAGWPYFRHFFNLLPFYVITYSM